MKMAPTKAVRQEMMKASPMKKSASKVKKSASKVKKVMEEWKEGKLHSGSKKGPEVKSRKQAIAIGLSEARKAGEKVKPMMKKATAKMPAMKKMMKARHA